MSRPYSTRLILPLAALYFFADRLDAVLRMNTAALRPGTSCHFDFTHDRSAPLTSAKQHLPAKKQLVARALSCPSEASVNKLPWVATCSLPQPITPGRLMCPLFAFGCLFTMCLAVEDLAAQRGQQGAPTSHLARPDSVLREQVRGMPTDSVQEVRVFTATFKPGAPNVRMTGYNRSATAKTRVVIFYVSSPGEPFLDPIGR